MSDAAKNLAGTVQALTFLTTEIAWRLTDVMVAKGVITKGEANATLYALAEGIRRDAHGMLLDEATNVIARDLESLADQIWPRGSEAR